MSFWMRKTTLDDADRMHPYDPFSFPVSTVTLNTAPKEPEYEWEFEYYPAGASKWVEQVATIYAPTREKAIQKLRDALGDSANSRWIGGYGDKQYDWTYQISYKGMREVR